MTADALRRSPLHDRGEELARLTGPVALTEIPFVGMLNLRVRPGLRFEAEAALACALPAPLGTSAGADVDVLWLGPDEFLVLTSDTTAMAERLNGAIASESGSVVDVSANRTTLQLGGISARDVLGKGVAIDLRQPVPWCAQTLLTSVPIILWHPEDEQWRLLIRPSFANYVADWLIDAAQEFG